MVCLAENRDERIKTLENALSLLSPEATEADKALIRGELQTLTDERDALAEAYERKKAQYQSHIDEVRSALVVIEKVASVQRFDPKKESVSALLRDEMKAYIETVRQSAWADGVTIPHG